MMGDKNTHVINYPQEFIQQVKKHYPDWPELHRLIDSGSEKAAQFLNPCGHATIRIESAKRELAELWTKLDNYLVENVAEKVNETYSEIIDLLDNLNWDETRQTLYVWALRLAHPEPGATETE